MAPGTEIDAIFASKSSSTIVEASSSKPKGTAKANLSPASTKKTKKKKKNDNATPEDNAFPRSASDLAATAKRKRAEPETILDPSAHGQRVNKTARPRGEEASNRAAKKVKTTLDEDGKFRDSRGKGPRRKTDEGFSIYKEDELGIDDQGGDTPLCPFDCRCCF